MVSSAGVPPLYVGTPQAVEVAEAGAAVIGSNLVQRQRVTVFQVRLRLGGKTHVHRHRLAVLCSQPIHRLVQGIGQGTLVVAWIELYAAAIFLLQVFFHAAGEIGGVFCHQCAVQHRTPDGCGYVRCLLPW